MVPLWIVVETLVPPFFRFLRRLVLVGRPVERVSFCVTRCGVVAWGCRFV